MLYTLDNKLITGYSDKSRETSLDNKSVARVPLSHYDFFLLKNFDMLAMAFCSLVISSLVAALALEDDEEPAPAAAAASEPTGTMAMSLESWEASSVGFTPPVNAFKVMPLPLALHHEFTSRN